MRIEHLQRIVAARQARNQYGPWPVGDTADTAREAARQDERDGDALMDETEIRHALS